MNSLGGGERSWQTTPPPSTSPGGRNSPQAVYTLVVFLRHSLCLDVFICTWCFSPSLELRRLSAFPALASRQVSLRRTGGPGVGAKDGVLLTALTASGGSVLSCGLLSPSPTGTPFPGSQACLRTEGHSGAARAWGVLCPAGGTIPDTEPSAPQRPLSLPGVCTDGPELTPGS